MEILEALGQGKKIDEYRKPKRETMKIFLNRASSKLNFFAPQKTL